MCRGHSAADRRLQSAAHRSRRRSIAAVSLVWLCCLVRYRRRSRPSEFPRLALFMEARLEARRDVIEASSRFNSLIERGLFESRHALSWTRALHFAPIEAHQAIIPGKPARRDRRRSEKQIRFLAISMRTIAYFLHVF